MSKKREDLQTAIDALAVVWRDSFGNTTDEGDDFFNACLSAVQRAGSGQNWEFSEGFLRRVKP